MTPTNPPALDPEKYETELVAFANRVQDGIASLSRSLAEERERAGKLQEALDATRRLLHGLVGALAAAGVAAALWAWQSSGRERDAEGSLPWRLVHVPWSMGDARHEEVWRVRTDTGDAEMLIDGWGNPKQGEERKKGYRSKGF